MLSFRHRKQTRKNVVDTTFQNVEERSTAKNYRLVNLLFVSKIFEKFVNNRFVDLVEKCGLVSDFQYGLQVFFSCRSSDSCI